MPQLGSLNDTHTEPETYKEITARGERSYKGKLIKNEDGTVEEDVISAPKGVFIPREEDYVSPEEDTIPVGQCTDPEKGITCRPQGVMVRYAVPFSLWEPMGPPPDYVHDEQNPYIYPNYYVHTNEKHEFPDGSVMGWHTLESAKEWIINELPKVHAEYFWDRPRKKYVPDRKKIGTDDEEYWTHEELEAGPAHWLRVNNEGPHLRIFGPETQPEGFISMIHKNLPEDRSVYRLPPEDEVPGVDQEELIAMIQGLGYKIYADFPLPVPDDPDMEKVKWADTSKWFGPKAKFQPNQDWSDVRGNCYLRHPDYFELPEHVQFDNYTPAQRWRIRSGLCRDAYRLPPKSEAQLFAEKLQQKREAKQAEKKANEAAEGSK